MANTPGDKGIVDISGGATFRADYNAGATAVRTALPENVANFGALPTPSDWADGGLLRFLEDTDTLYYWDGAGWFPCTPVVTDLYTNLQTDTTNSTTRVRVQRGIGKLIGNGTTTIAEAITFPTAFSVIPTIQVTVMGSRATGAYNSASLALVGAAANVSGTSTTGATVNLIGITGSLSAANDYYYSWEATGVLP